MKLIFVFSKSIFEIKNLISLFSVLVSSFGLSSLGFTIFAKLNVPSFSSIIFKYIPSKVIFLKLICLFSIDFNKEKSIQVIKNTPIAYAQKGWDVSYLVARDTAECGTYFYEKEISPSEIRLYRFQMPFCALRKKYLPPLFRTLITKITLFFIYFIKKGVRIQKKIEITSWEPSRKKERRVKEIYY